ncbi:MAG: hypothetical protein WBW79_16105 [Desulfocapsaceae bacterium]|jgi:hypothetical protein
MSIVDEELPVPARQCSGSRVETNYIVDCTGTRENEMMNNDQKQPLAAFGVRVKTIIVLVLFGCLLFLVIDISDISRLAERFYGDHQAKDQTSSLPMPGEDIVVDQEALSEAMQQVYLQKLAEIEQAESSEPTDRFFYIIEIVGGSDLEAVDITIEPDQVIMLSAGGTETTINRSLVKKIHRIKLPPSSDKN